MAALAPKNGREGRSPRGLIAEPPSSALPTIEGVTPIASLQWRQSARIAGRVKTLRVQPWSGVPTLECVLVDNSGESIVLVFPRSSIHPGNRSGTLMAVEASVGKHKGMLAMINPLYELLSVSFPKRS